MIQANNVTVQFGGRVLFERVNVTFTRLLSADVR